MVILFRPYLSELTVDSDGKYKDSLDDNQTKFQKSKTECKWKDCGKMFDNLDLLSSHVSKDHSIPGDGGLFYCKWNNCNRGLRGFNARYKMLVHVRIHTNEKPHQCCHCSKSFSRAENLKIHCRSHTGERPYICNIPGCGKAYSNSSDRFKHSKTHMIEKPYVCKIPGCSKRYTDPSSLRKHVKTYKHYEPSTEDTLNNRQAEKRCQNDSDENILQLVNEHSARIKTHRSTEEDFGKSSLKREHFVDFNNIGDDESVPQQKSSIPIHVVRPFPEQTDLVANYSLYTSRASVKAFSSEQYYPIEIRSRIINEKIRTSNSRSDYHLPYFINRDDLIMEQPLDLSVNNRP